MAKKTICIIGMLIGIVIGVLGFIVLNEDTLSWIDTSISFGADFYTRSYQATARATSALYSIQNLLAEGIGFLLIAIGLTDLCVFTYLLTCSAKTKNVVTQANNQVVTNNNPSAAPWMCANSNIINDRTSPVCRNCGKLK